MKINVFSNVRFGTIGAEVFHVFTNLLLGQLFYSSIVGRLAIFRLLSECIILCFRFCKRLSMGFYSVPFFFLRLVILVSMLLRRVQKVNFGAGEG
jgi:hypothetical protein